MLDELRPTRSFRFNYSPKTQKLNLSTAKLNPSVRSERLRIGWKIWSNRPILATRCKTPIPSCRARNTGWLVKEPPTSIVRIIPAMVKLACAIRIRVQIPCLEPSSLCDKPDKDGDLSRFVRPASTIHCQFASGEPAGASCGNCRCENHPAGFERRLDSRAKGSKHSPGPSAGFGVGFGRG